MIKKIEKKIVLADDININIDLSIPIFTDRVIEDDGFIDDIMIKQCLRGLKEAISTYKSSELPDRFISGQEIIITNDLPEGIYGAMSMIGDMMLIEADAISDIRPVKASYLFAHEIGHKIERYRDMSESKNMVAHLLGIGLYGHERMISEALADEVGNIAVRENSDACRFNYYLEDEQHKVLQHTILKDIYRV